MSNQKAGGDTVTLVTQLHLQPLSLEHLNRFIADTLHCALERSEPLATLIYTKTQGNFALARVLLQYSHLQGALTFSHGSQCWQWELDRLGTINLEEAQKYFETHPSSSLVSEPTLDLLNPQDLFQEQLWVGLNTQDDFQGASLPWLYKAGNTKCLSQVSELAIAYFLGHEKRGAQLILTIADCLHVEEIDPFLALYGYFYSALTLAATLPSPFEPEHPQWQTLLQFQQRLEALSSHQPEDLGILSLIVAAEIARLQNDRHLTAELYDQGIQRATAAGKLHYQGLVNELAGKFYWHHHRERLAQAYLQEARLAYLQWEVETKIEQFDRAYDPILEISSLNRASLDTGETLPNDTPSSFLSVNTKLLDLMTVIKASQALSGEIVLDSLLQRLVHIVIEEAGAQKGVFMLVKNNGLEIQAEGTVIQDRSQQQTSVKLHTLPVEESQFLAISVVYYVQRTEQTLVLDDARTDERFAADPYMIRHQPKSVICLPVIHRRKLTGILYLENSLAAGAFTLDSLEILRLLMVQIAISIENAIFYRSVQESEVQYRILAQQMEYAAFHDTLTGLPNRALFMDRLQQAIARSQQHAEHQFAVLFLDLDRFKVVNDSLGHIAGDQLLVTVAARLASCLRPTDTVARLGGDEFVVLLDGIQDATQVITVANHLQTALKHPLSVADRDVFITASIGITLSGKHCQRAEALLRDADIAMYRAKVQGKARFVIFDSAMHTQAIILLEMETDLRQAINQSLERGLGESELCLYYQPFISLSTGKITGMEALLRWHHPHKGLIYPGQFIPMAEETGLIIDLDRWVMREACRQFKYWQSTIADFPALSVSVNLSSKQFSQPGLIRWLDQTLAMTGLSAQYLKLEITESTVMENAESAITIFQHLKERQIHICIDDFGTGYSSLSYLRKFPINTLKVDRSFVLDGNFNRENTDIIRAIITLAHSLNMDVIAEGVETLEQVELLTDLQAEYAQGYYFSQAIPAAAIAVLIAQQG